jgi:uncharacterized protein (TIGR02246 family)
MKIVLVSVLTVLLMGVPIVIDTAVVEAARTLQEVWSVAEAFERAWNKHDVDGMASLFTDGANMVTAEGWVWFGKTEIRRGLEWMHPNTFKNTAIHIDSSLVHSEGFVTKDTAVVIVTLRVGNGAVSDGRQLPEAKKRLSLFLVKRKGRWLIESFHNTTIDPQAEQNDPMRKR